MRRSSNETGILQRCDCVKTLSKLLASLTSRSQGACHVRKRPCEYNIDSPAPSIGFQELPQLHTTALRRPTFAQSYIPLLTPYRPQIPPLADSYYHETPFFPIPNLPSPNCKVMASGAPSRKFRVIEDSGRVSMDEVRMSADTNRVDQLVKSQSRSHQGC